jgi:ribosomal-protein-alanine N-acetyltransferase
LTNIDEITIERLQEKHLNSLMEIENECFNIPWTKEMFAEELSNEKAVYFVAVFKNNLVGYGGIWFVLDEGQITNIAVKNNFRRRGIGKKILQKLINTAKEKKCFSMTLEVRISNHDAINLYKKEGFKEEGVRKKYYADNAEDGLIMWKYM